MTKDNEQLAWDKMQGLLPVIVQDAQNGNVLMLGYMNREALEQTISTQRVTFYSRSKQRLWRKGETSGHELQVTAIHADCDGDALLIMADPLGPTCHLGNVSCFGEESYTRCSFIHTLEHIIAERQQQYADGTASDESYTAKLFAAGIRRMAQKVGEEGVEMALAAVDDNIDSLKQEAADLLFHYLVLLKARDAGINDILDILQERHRARPYR